MAISAFTSVATPVHASGATPPSSSVILPDKASESLVPPEALKTFRYWDNVSGQASSARFTPVQRSSRTPIFKASTPVGSTDQYGVGASWSVAAPIRKGDVLLARFAARTLSARQETGEGEGLFYFEEKTSRTREFTYSFSAGPEWTVVNVPFVAQVDHSGESSALSLTFANLPQTLEFTNIELLNFGKRAALSDLPVTRQTYAGRNEDAAWRKQALDRIEKLRTAPLTIRVVDPTGKPIRGATVEAVMTSSDFLWGTAVDVGQLLASGSDGDRYRVVVRDMFDTAVIENGLKWPLWLKPDEKAKTLRALDWLATNDTRVKGTTLVWTAWKFTPDEVVNDPQRNTKLASLISGHIADITRETKDKLIGWDVVNEAVHEDDYWKVLPRSAAAQWFKAVRAQEPGLELTFNEYGMLNRSSSPMMISQVLEFVGDLERHGAKIDVLGVQAHYGQMVRAPEAILADLDLLTARGHKVQITEYDFNTRDEQLQADFTRDFLIAVYSHPGVNGYYQWGFWQPKHWKPDAAMFRADWSEKPSVKVWRDLVMAQWNTKLPGITDGSGSLSGKGHLGRYKIKVTAGGKSKVISNWQLARGGVPLVVNLP